MFSFWNPNSYEGNLRTCKVLIYTRLNKQYWVGSLLLPRSIKECISEEREILCTNARLFSSRCALNAHGLFQEPIHYSPVPGFTTSSRLCGFGSRFLALCACSRCRDWRRFLC